MYGTPLFPPKNSMTGYIMLNIEHLRQATNIILVVLKHIALKSRGKGDAFVRIKLGSNKCLILYDIVLKINTG